MLWPFTAVHGRARTLADIYWIEIESGELQARDRVPSIRTLAQEYDVATTTAQKVVEALRDEGLIVTSPMGRSWRSPRASATTSRDGRLCR